MLLFEMIKILFPIFSIIKICARISSTITHIYLYLSKKYILYMNYTYTQNIAKRLRKLPSPSPLQQIYSAYGGGVGLLLCPLYHDICEVATVVRPLFFLLQKSPVLYLCCGRHKEQPTSWTHQLAVYTKSYNRVGLNPQYSAV